MNEMMNERITDTVDRLQKVESVLDFLTTEAKNNGLCVILTNCQAELQESIGNLLQIQDVEVVE